MSEDLPLRARYSALTSTKAGAVRQHWRSLRQASSASGQKRRQPWKKKEKENSGEEAQGGERTESLNIKSGALRHTSRHWLLPWTAGWGITEREVWEDQLLRWGQFVPISTALPAVQLPTFPSTLSGHFIRNTLLAPTKWLLNLAQVWMCPDMLFSRTWGVPGVILLSSFDIVALHFCLCNSNEPFVLIVPYLHPKICHFKK